MTVGTPPAPGTSGPEFAAKFASRNRLVAAYTLLAPLPDSPMTGVGVRRVGGVSPRAAWVTLSGTFLREAIGLIFNEIPGQRGLFVGVTVLVIAAALALSKSHAWPPSVAKPEHRQARAAAAFGISAIGFFGDICPKLIF